MLIEQLINLGTLLDQLFSVRVYFHTNTHTHTAPLNVEQYHQIANWLRAVGDDGGYYFPIVLLDIYRGRKGVTA